MAVTFAQDPAFTSTPSDPQALNPSTNPSSGDILVVVAAQSGSGGGPQNSDPSLESDSFGGTWTQEKNTVWGVRRRLVGWVNDDWTTASGSVSVNWANNQDRATGLLVAAGVSAYQEDADGGDLSGTSVTVDFGTAGYATGGQAVIIQMEDTVAISESGGTEWTKLTQVTDADGLRSLAVFVHVGTLSDTTPTFSWTGTNGYTYWGLSFTAATGGAATIDPVGRSSTGSAGTAPISAAVTITATGQSSTGTVGSAGVSAETDVDPVGQSSTGTVGSATIEISTAVDPIGQSSTGLVGAATIVAAADIVPTGQTSAGVVGSAGVNAQADIDPVGQSSTGTAGTADIVTGVLINPVGQSSAGTVGAATVDADADIVPVGQSSTGAVGSAGVEAAATINGAGQSSTGTAGTADIVAGILIEPVGHFSTGLAGTADVVAEVDVDPVGQSSTGASGVAPVTPAGSVTGRSVNDAVANYASDGTFNTGEQELWTVYGQESDIVVAASVIAGRNVFYSEALKILAEQ